MSDANANFENAGTRDGAETPEACVQRPQTPNLSPEHRQIRKWLEDASRAHRGDVYSGKRDETRFKKPIQLDAKLFDTDGSRTVMATMHNISCTGIAFWVRHEVELGTTVEVRECDPSNQISWVSATVTHCRQGLRGFVVGARFEHPLAEPPPDWNESMADLHPAPAQPEPAEPTVETEHSEASTAAPQPEAASDGPDKHPATGASEPDDEVKGEGDRGILSWFGLG